MPDATSQIGDADSCQAHGLFSGSKMLTEGHTHGPLSGSQMLTPVIHMVSSLVPIC